MNSRMRYESVYANYSVVIWSNRITVTFIITGIAFKLKFTIILNTKSLYKLSILSKNPIFIKIINESQRMYYRSEWIRMFKEKSSSIYILLCTDHGKQSAKADKCCPKNKNTKMESVLLIAGNKPISTKILADLKARKWLF